MVRQIGFLTEWQLYAQKIEGDSWVGEKLDPGKIEKMSGMLTRKPILFGSVWLNYTDASDRSTNRAIV